MESRTGGTDTGIRRPRRLIAGSVSAFALVAALFAGVASTSAERVLGTPGTAYVADQLLVRFASGAADARINQINGEMGASTVQVFHIVPNLQLVHLPKGLSVSDAVVRYLGYADVLYAEPNYRSHIDETIPNDPSFTTQWNWMNTGQLGGKVDADVDATDAWDLTTGSSTVIVGMIDTGVQLHPHLHVDLAANIWSNTAECSGVPGVDDEGDGYIDDCHGIDTINHDSDPDDDYNHGTHVAGIMGAVGNNGVGVTGLNWNVKVLPCKSHDNTGNGTNDSLLECLQYMTDWKARGEHIVATNNSYGGCLEACDYSQSLYDAIKSNMDSGILFVASAGNDSADNDLVLKYPADYFLPNVIAVASTDYSDERSSFSNWGRRTVSLGAPGTSVYSTLFTDAYGYESGTSMAAPHVTGLAGFIAAFNPGLNWRAIRNLIVAGGDPKTSVKGITITGRRMNAYGSLNCTNTRVFGPLRPLEMVGGGQQTIAALNILCGAPAGNLSVRISPGNLKIHLTDDGRRADLASQDGIYSGFWTPCAAGTYTITFSNGRQATTTVSGSTPCITLNPNSGPPGTVVSVDGTGFGASETVRIVFDTSNVGSAITDSNGAFSTTISVPAGAVQGPHTVTATGHTSDLVGQATFRVT